MTKSKNRTARLSDNRDCIIDSDGMKVDFDDPGIVHVYLTDLPGYTKSLQKRIYQKNGRKVRFLGDTTKEILQLARQLCSGRECLPMAATAGFFLEDIQKYRQEDEITIYFTLDEPGPCQHAGWPILWETFANRLNIKNAIFCVWPSYSNKYFGMDSKFPMEFITSFILGDLFSEAETALRCLASDYNSAMEIFNLGRDWMAD